MALYFYFNESSGTLVYSDKSSYSGSGYTSVGQQTNTNPTQASDWVFNSIRAKIKTVSKDSSSSASISDLTSTSYMFKGCNQLQTLDLSRLDTSNVTDMSYMFNGCSYLITVNLFYLDTSKVTNMASMFNGCLGLQSLTIPSSFDTSKVTNMSYMFYSCISLTSIVIPSSVDMSKVTSMSSMFSGCRSLQNVSLPTVTTSSLTTMEAMFYGCSQLSYIDLSSFDLSQLTTTNSMFYNCTTLTSVDFPQCIAYKLTNMSNMFYGCSSLENVDFSPLEIPNVTTLGDVFRGCSSLTKLDLSSMDTSNVTSMTNLFYGCTALADLNISTFTTPKLKSMSYMFYNCSSLKTLDVSSFDTSNVTSMDSVFRGCSALVSIDLLMFNTSKVDTMSSMFYECEQLTELDLSSFDTSNVTSMSYMFQSCSSITNLDLSTFNTSKVTNTTSMFSGCSSLTTLDISSFDMSKVTSMSNMFSTNAPLKLISISGSMGNTLSQLPNEKYYSTVDGSEVARESLTAGTWARDKEDVTLVTSVIQQHMMVQSINRRINQQKRYFLDKTKSTKPSVILIGDSYGEGYSPDGNTISWIQQVTSYCSRIGWKVYSAYKGGAGIVNASQGQNFGQILNSLASSVSDPDSVKKIIIAGGWNDNGQEDVSNFESGIDAIVQASSRYANAEVIYAIIGNGDFNVHSISKNIDGLFNMYRALLSANSRIDASNRLTIVDGSKSIRFHSHFSSDGFHPSQEGQNMISQFMVNVFNCQPYYPCIPAPEFQLEKIYNMDSGYQSSVAFTGINSMNNDYCQSGFLKGIITFDSPKQLVCNGDVGLVLYTDSVNDSVNFISRHIDIYTSVIMRQENSYYTIPTLAHCYSDNSMGKVFQLYFHDVNDAKTNYRTIQCSQIQFNPIS